MLLTLSYMHEKVNICHARAVYARVYMKNAELQEKHPYKKYLFLTTLV